MERHRYLWLWFQNHRELLPRDARVLHIAPEPALVTRLKSLARLRHVSVDISSPAADVRADITRLPFADGVFDLIICSHVMEHVMDEQAALRAMHRVLAPRGRLIVMVPIDETKQTTYEDPSIVSPTARQVAYWQDDHVRLYGLDVAERLAAGGFDVTSYRTEDLFGTPVIERHQLWPREQILLLAHPSVEVSP